MMIFRAIVVGVIVVLFALPVFAQTATPTLTSTPTPTNTPTPQTVVWMDLPDGLGNTQPARFEFVITVGDVAIFIVLFAQLCLAYVAFTMWRKQVA